MRRFDDGIAENNRAQQLDPLSSVANMLLGQSLYYAHRYDEAIDQLRTTVDLSPDNWVAHDLLGWCYEIKGDLAQALAEFQKARQIENSIAEPLASLGRGYALLGKTEEAHKVLDQAIGAKLIEMKDGKAFDKDGTEITRFGFHSFRHSLLMANGENPKVVQTILRHSRMDMTLYYTHSQKGEMIGAQGSVLDRLLPQRGPERVQ